MPELQTGDPAEWPPQLGDLWRDADGDPWFCLADNEMVTPETATMHTDRVLSKYGPLTLVHREGAVQ